MSVSPKIKILQCIRQGKIGGGESHLLSLVENINREIFEPIVLSFTDGPMIDRLKELNVNTKVIHTEKPFDLRKWKAVKNFVKETDVNLIHAHGTRAGSNILWAAKRLKLPFIYTIHGWSFHQDQNTVVRKARILGERFITQKSNLNISVSASNQQTGIETIPGFTSTIINNGINIEKFSPYRNFIPLRKQLGIADNKILYLFVARFTFQKQPIALIQAFKKAHKLNPDIHLLMVGEGEQKEEAEKMLKDEGLDHYITLLPFRLDVPDILAAADVFVLPSLWEGLPIGLLEAMAMGKTIIATDVDGTREIIETNVNGILINTETLIPSLASAIEILAIDVEKRELLANNARKTVENRFNAEYMTREIESVYLKFL